MRRALFLCLVAGLSACRDGSAKADVSPPTPPATTAPAPAAVDTSAKNDLPVDLSKLRDDERATFYKLVKQIPSACGKAHSLEVSLKTDPKCRRSVFGARYLVRLILAKLLPSEVEE